MAQSGGGLAEGGGARARNRPPGQGADPDLRRPEKIRTEVFSSFSASRGPRPAPGRSKKKDLQRREKITTRAFGYFRLPGALNGPWDRQKTTQDGKPVPGRGSGLPGAAYGKKHDIGCLGPLRGRRGRGRAATGRGREDPDSGIEARFACFFLRGGLFLRVDGPPSSKPPFSESDPGPSPAGADPQKSRPRRPRENRTRTIR